MPSGSVWVTLMASGCDRVFSSVAPSKALVGGVVARVVVKLATARGSHTPKARWMAFLGISRLSIWIWMSVLLDMTSALDGATELKTLSQPLAMSVTQTLPEGINYTVAWGGSKSTSNSTFNNYNPALASNLSITVSQPLIQNRGAYVNRLMLMTARSRLKISEYGLKVQMLTLVSAAESAYWDVVAARESLKVAEGARDVSAAFLKLSQKQLELGALSPLDIYNPEQQLATNEVLVAQARFTLVQKEDVLRKQI